MRPPGENNPGDGAELVYGRDARKRAIDSRVVARVSSQREVVVVDLFR